MSSVVGRERALKLVHTDPGQALTTARAIPDAWSRAQALAWVARFAPQDIARPALRDARAAAKEGKDEYQRAAALAWPIRAALETRQKTQYEVMFAEATRQLPDIENMGSRAEAADWVFHAAAPGGAALWQPLLDALPTLCPPDDHWRCARLFRGIATVLAAVTPDAAARFIDAMPHGKARDRCLRDRAKGASAEPRRYFW